MPIECLSIVFHCIIIGNKWDRVNEELSYRNMDTEMFTFLAATLSPVSLFITFCQLPSTFSSDVLITPRKF